MKFFAERCLRKPLILIPYKWNYTHCLHVICKLIDYDENKIHKCALWPSDNVNTIVSCYIYMSEEEQQKIMNKLQNFRQEFQEKADKTRYTKVNVIIDELIRGQNKYRPLSPNELRALK